MKISVILSARMGSRRFPGKVLEVLHGKPVLKHIIETLQKLKDSKHIDDFIIATPNTPENKKLWDFLEQHQVNYFKGSNEDVLDRYYQCAKKK